MSLEAAIVHHLVGYRCSNAIPQAHMVA